MKRDINTVFIENIHIEVYHTWLNIYVHNTVYEALYHTDTLNGTKKETWEGTSGLFWINEKHNSWFMAFNASKISYGTIAHECYHATCRILKRKGIFYSEETEEAYAYLLDYLVTKTIEHLKDYL